MLLRVSRRALRHASRGCSKRLMATSTQSDPLFTPTEEHGALRDLVRSFAETELEPQAIAHDREEKFNDKLFRRCGELGLLGITIDTQYGGSGMDAVATVIGAEELTAADPGFSLAWGAHSCLFAHNLFINGSEEQKARILPAATSGKLLGGLCMSEASGGTDVLAMGTRAVQDGEVYVLNGSKMWITNGYRYPGEPGDAFLVYARTADSGDPRKDFSMFLVEKGMPGFSLGQMIRDKCGMRASNTAELVFENVRVPRANLVGAEGDAVRLMMRNLEMERAVMGGGMALGVVRRALDVMNKYSKERKSFGVPIRDFGQIQRYLAESYAEYAAGKAYVYHIAQKIDLHQSGNRLDCDAIKLLCATMAKNVADRAIQVLGGYGYCAEYRVEQLWRDTKVMEIGGGTIEANHRNMTRDLEKVDTFR